MTLSITLVLASESVSIRTEIPPTKTFIVPPVFPPPTECVLVVITLGSQVIIINRLHIRSPLVWHILCRKSFVFGVTLVWQTLAKCPIL